MTQVHAPLVPQTCEDRQIGKGLGAGGGPSPLRGSSFQGSPPIGTQLEQLRGGDLTLLCECERSVGRVGRQSVEAKGPVPDWPFRPTPTTLFDLDYRSNGADI